MTGGTEYAKIINYRLAEVAQHYKIAMGVGSQRVAVENPDVENTFDVRKVAPDILLFEQARVARRLYRDDLAKRLYPLGGISGCQ